MAYVSLYRKYRSQTFSDLIGQEHVVRTLQNGIASQRIAHSYLFTGPRGTGKTSTARLLSKALCCENGPSPEPDNTCHICLSITAGSCIDVIEMDAASESGVEDIRDQIVEVTEYRPMVCRYKIFIIDEVHDLSSKAFDALLKTIEEPPPHIIFILATTEYNKVPPTIRSRCQKYEFRRGTIQDLFGRLDHVIKGEGIEAEPAAISAIARMADGGYRDALSLLEQVMLVSEGKITLDQVYDQLGLVSEDTIDQLFLAIRQKDVSSLVAQLEEIARLGRDPRAILESMMYRLSDLTRASYQVTDRSMDAARDASLHETSVHLGRDLILRLRNNIAESHKLIRDISLPRLWLESRLVGLATEAEIASIANAPISRNMPTAGDRPSPQPAEKRVAEPPKPSTTSPKPDETPVSQEPMEEGITINAPNPTGDLLLDEALIAWHKTLLALPQKSKTLARKLYATQVLSRQGNLVTIRMERQHQHEWLFDDPKKIKAVLEMFRGNFLPESDLNFVVMKEGSVREDAEAVELPLEGKLLEERVKEIFNENNGPKS